VEGFYIFNVLGTQTFSDPTDYMINQMHQIAFRTSLQAAKDNATASKAQQTVRYRGNSAPTIYSTNFKLIAAAAVLNNLAVIAILMTFKGWWTLGRKFSLLPLEFARAFSAPLLRGADSNATWREISEQVGKRNVKYGEISDETASDAEIEIVELLFANSRDIREPIPRYRRLLG
jgi:hypothetical protein